MSRRPRFLAGLLSILCVFSGEPVRATDPLQRVDSFRDRFEFRFGVGPHSPDAVESGVLAINTELVFPQLRFGDLDPQWAFAVPRLHLGGVFNFGGRTNYGYLGFLWTLGLTERFFAEAFVGGAIHDGSLAGDPVNHRAALGCRVGFHVGGSVGYRFAPQWAVMFTYDHLSNGNAALDACSRNQGLNEYLLRVGYSF
jgi:hypothetical protein